MVSITYGYLTKSKRISLGLEKTHYNEAFCIANGNSQKKLNQSHFIKAMQMLWGKKINDYGYAQLFKILQSKSAEYGKTVFQIDKFYPSSKVCSCCGYKLESLDLKTRQWQCPECKTIHSRDINAANNILRVGASTIAREAVIPAKAG